MKRKIHLLLLFLFYLLSLFVLPSHAQSLRSAYPVQVTAFLPPPHSLYLGDYCSSTKEKLVVNLLNRDLQEPELEVKLHLSIRSSGGITLETKDYRVYPSIGLHAGTPCQLTKDDLCPYFQQENLDIQGTLPGGKLPEGLLEICITVLETHTGRVVSSASCARAWINLNRPPLLNLPANSAAFPFREPLNILFQWTPRHQALSSVEYEFVLKEIVDEAIAPQAAFPYSREIYTTTLRSTNLAYTPLQPPLQENRQYAWQVRAAVRDGFEELNVFENQGYSEIHTFSIRPGCFPPTGVSHRQHLQHLVVEWTPPANAGQSVVAYRSKAAGGDWHSVQGNAGYANLTDLTHSIEYEYKAGTLCVDGSIRYGEVHTALLENTREDLEASCGILPRNDNSNTAPLKFMNPGDVFLAGDFPVSVTRVSGENGYFSGNGWIRIPFMNDAKVAVEFKAIGINADSRLTSGVVETSYDQFEANIANMDDLWHGGSTTPTPPGTVTTDAKAGFEIPEEGGVKLSEDGTILLIIDPDGNPVGTIPVPDQYAEAVQKGLPVTITIEDAKGTTCEVKTGGKETGSISPTGKKGDPLAPGSFDETKLAGGKAVVEFLPAPESRYAFDTWKDYYRKVSLIVSRGGYEFIGSYAVPFKLIPPGKSDPVAVRVRVVDKKLNPDSILYKTSTGYEVKPEEGILTLSAGKENSYQDLYALYPDGQGGYLTLGKLKILSYSEPTFPVVLIPVNGNRVDESQIETYLNSREVYGSLGIRWEVSQDTTFTYPDENLHSDGSDLFSRYTDEMKRLNSAYRASRGQLDNKTVYLFVLRSGSVNGLYAGGDMPRSGQFGYLFTEGSHDLNRTIAHELAHGKFRLRHTFDSEYGQVKKLARGGTKNLMDYGTGTELAKWQWDEIFNPALLVSPFESDEEAMEIFVRSTEKLYACIEEIRQSLISGTEVQPRQYSIYNDGSTMTLGGHDYQGIIFKRMKAGQAVTLKNSQPELFEERNFNGVTQYGIGFRDKAITLLLSTHKDREKLLSYLLEKRSDNFLLFVSGYDFADEFREFANKNETKKEAESWLDRAIGYVNKTPVSSDSKEYWGSSFVDAMVSRLKSKKITYMAGHDDVGTSNHRSIGGFSASLVAYFNVRYNPSSCYHNPDCYFPSTKANVSGFNQRRNNGRSQGLEYVNLLKQDCARDAAGQVQDTVDVVCHSMGFAHALGIIDALKEAMKNDLKGLKLGRFYIFAPENACSGEVDISDWKEVRQYGSNEVELKDQPWLQDGVAPQCKINGLDYNNRTYIEDQIKDGQDIPQGFLESHKIKNYEWVFTIKEKQNGYIEPRK